jgi:WD40 repeat protein
VVGRADEAEQVIEVVCARPGGAVAITTALEGAGGFGKTTLADLVCADERVHEHFASRMYVVTIGRDVRAQAAIAAKVVETIEFITGHTTTYTDPALAGDELGRLLDQHPDRRTLLVLDDVWTREQLYPFLRGGRQCVRLITTRVPAVLPDTAVRVRVDQMTRVQAEAVLRRDLPLVPELLVSGLVKATGRWPLLLRLVNQAICKQVATGAEPAAAAGAMLARLREQGPVAADPSMAPDLGDPTQRRKLVRATILAATGLLPEGDAERLAELGIFAEDEAIPIPVASRLWSATASLDEWRSRGLCHDLASLSLLTITAENAGSVILHDVIRDYLRHDLGDARIAHLNGIFVDDIEDGLPAAAPLMPSASWPRSAWWQETSGYLLDYAVTHLLAAGRITQAEALACDLRWIGTRLHQRGPTALLADCTRISTPTTTACARDLARIAHLLVPIQPARALTDTLHSYLQPLPRWAEQVAALAARPASRSRLFNAWPPPGMPVPAQLHAFTVSRSGIKAATMSPDGSWIATGGPGDTVQILDLDTGKITATLPGHRISVKGVAVSPDGSWIVTGDFDGTLRIWDVGTGQITAIFEGHTDPVTAVAVSPDGTRIVAGDSRGMVRIWDVGTGQITAILEGHKDPVNAVAVSPDGSWIATGSGDNIVVGGAIEDDDTVRIWDVSTGQVTASLEGHTDAVNAVVISPDGSWIATGSRDKTVRIWDPVTAQTSAIFEGHAGGVYGAAVSPDGTWIATGSSDDTVRIWDVSTSQIKASLQGHVHGVNAVAVSPDGTWIVTCDGTGTVRTWDPADQGPASREEDAALAFVVTASPDGTWIATGDHYGTIRTRDLATGQTSACLRGHTQVVLAIAVSPDGTWIATGSSDGTVRIWNPATERSIAFAPGHTHVVSAVAVSPDGTWLATGGDDGTVRIWDLATGQCTSTLMGHADDVSTLAVSPDGTWIAVGDWGGTVRIWDLATGRTTVALAGHTGIVRQAAVSPDGTWLATSGDDGTVRIWDLATGRTTATLEGHTDAVPAVAVSPDGTWIATGCRDGTVRIWHAASAHCVAAVRIDAPLRSIAWGIALAITSERGLHGYRFVAG